MHVPITSRTLPGPRDCFETCRRQRTNEWSPSYIYTLFNSPHLWVPPVLKIYMNLLESPPRCCRDFIDIIHFKATNVNPWCKFFVPRWAYTQRGKLAQIYILQQGDICAPKNSLSCYQTHFRCPLNINNGEIAKFNEMHTPQPPILEYEI